MFKLADAAESGFDADRLARIEPFLKANYIDNGRLPMTQIVVARDGRPVHYGKQGHLRKDGTPIRDDAIYRIASMTKAITAIAFMQLVEKCEVALDDPVVRVIPEFADLGVYSGGGGTLPFAPVRPAPRMRFIDLLTHMSGLTYGFQNRTSVDAAYRKAGLDVARGEMSSNEYIAALAKVPLEFAPGEKWNYSVSSDVLGIAVERLSGLTLGEYCARHIFEPLGMTDTGFDLSDDQLSRLADAYQYVSGGKPNMVDSGADGRMAAPARFHGGGGGLAGSLSDYHRFTTMLLNGGELDGQRILAPKTLSLMTANHLPGNQDLSQVSQSLFSEASNAGTGFGLGFATVIDPPATLMPASIGEFYWGGAWSTAFFVDPVERITMVFMTQLYPSNIYPIRRQLKTLIYAALTESRA